MARLGPWSRRTQVGRTVWTRIVRPLAFRSVLPAPLRRTVVPIIASAIGCDLEVLAELVVSGLLPQRHDVLAQLVPIQIETERVEEERLGDQVVERQHADLFEEMCEEDIVVRLETLFQEAPKRRCDRLAEHQRHDSDEGGGVLLGYAPKIWHGRTLVGWATHGFRSLWRL